MYELSTLLPVMTASTLCVAQRITTCTSGRHSMSFTNSPRRVETEMITGKASKVGVKFPIHLTWASHQLLYSPSQLTMLLWLRPSLLQTPVWSSSLSLSSWILRIRTRQLFEEKCWYLETTMAPSKYSSTSSNQDLANCSSPSSRITLSLLQNS